MQLRRIIAWCGFWVMGLSPGPVAAAVLRSGEPDISLIVAAMLLLGGLLVLFGWYYRHGTKPALAYLYRRRGVRLHSAVVTANVFRIGRHPGNELRLSPKTVSRFHAELVRNPNGTFSIHDTESKNGVRVGMRPVRSSVLKEGDVIEVGGVRLKFTRRPRDYNAHGNTVVMENNASRYDTRRRREVRRKLTTGVHLYNDEVGWVNGKMRNIGRGGAFIETGVKLPARLPLDILVAVAGNRQRKWLRLTGEIAWSDAQGIGVSFTDRDPLQVQQLLDAAA